MVFKRKDVRGDPRRGRVSRLDMDRGVEALLRAYGVGLDDVESDVLAFLGVALVFPAVKIGAVGFQNVVDSVAEGCNKIGA